MGLKTSAISDSRGVAAPQAKDFDPPKKTVETAPKIKDTIDAPSTKVGASDENPKTIKARILGCINFVWSWIVSHLLCCFFKNKGKVEEPSAQPSLSQTLKPEKLPQEALPSSSHSPLLAKETTEPQIVNPSRTTEQAPQKDPRQNLADINNISKTINIAEAIGVKERSRSPEISAAEALRDGVVYNRHLKRLAAGNLPTKAERDLSSEEQSMSLTPKMPEKDSLENNDMFSPDFISLTDKNSSERPLSPVESKRVSQKEEEPSLVPEVLDAAAFAKKVALANAAAPAKDDANGPINFWYREKLNRDLSQDRLEKFAQVDALVKKEAQDQEIINLINLLFAGDQEMKERLQKSFAAGNKEALSRVLQQNVGYAQYRLENNHVLEFNESLLRGFLRGEDIVTVFSNLSRQAKDYLLEHCKKANQLKQLAEEELIGLLRKGPNHFSIVKMNCRIAKKIQDAISSFFAVPKKSASEEKRTAGLQSSYIPEVSKSRALFVASEGRYKSHLFAEMDVAANEVEKLARSDATVEEVQKMIRKSFSSEEDIFGVLCEGQLRLGKEQLLVYMTDMSKLRWISIVYGEAVTFLKDNVVAKVPAQEMEFAFELLDPMTKAILIENFPREEDLKPVSEQELLKTLREGIDNEDVKALTEEVFRKLASPFTRSRVFVS